MNKFNILEYIYLCYFFVLFIIAFITAEIIIRRRPKDVTPEVSKKSIPLHSVTDKYNILAIVFFIGSWVTGYKSSCLDFKLSLTSSYFFYTVSYATTSVLGIFFSYLSRNDNKFLLRIWKGVCATFVNFILAILVWDIFTFIMMLWYQFHQ